MECTTPRTFTRNCCCIPLRTEMDTRTPTASPKSTSISLVLINVVGETAVQNLIVHACSVMCQFIQCPARKFRDLFCCQPRPLSVRICLEEGLNQLSTLRAWRSTTSACRTYTFFLSDWEIEEKKTGVRRLICFVRSPRQYSLGCRTAGALAPDLSHEN